MTRKPTFKVGPTRLPDRETCKIVAAAILVGKAAAKRTELAAGMEDFKRLDQLLRLAEHSIRNLDTLDGSASLIDHLDGVRAELAQRLGSRLAGRTKQKVDRFLSEFDGHVECVRRMGEGDRPGELSAVGEVFDLARTLVERSYDEIMRDDLPASVDVCLNVQGRPGHHPTRAATTFETTDRLETRSAEIHVEFARDSFDAEEGYFGLLAKVHHELFVHAVQALDATERRRPFGDQCPLAEGMVDRAAYLALQTQLTTSALPDGLNDLRQRFSVASERQHVDRHRPPPNNAPLAQKMAHEARDFGRMVFDQLLAARGGGPHALDWTQALTLRLNLLDLSADERRDVVIAIHTRLGGSYGQRIKAMGELDAVRNGRSPLDLL